MITILHGEDIVKSRLALDELKKRHESRELIVLNGPNLTLAGVKLALEAKSLFGQDKLVIFENLLSGKKKSKDQDAILKYLASEAQMVDFALWSDKEISRAFLRQFPQAQIKFFKPDSLLFRFLDTVEPDNGRVMIEGLRKISAQGEINLVFYMLIRQFRLLLFLKSGEKEGLEEINRLADWQKVKINAQAQAFSPETLLKAYRDLLEIDYKEKTGLSVYSLSQTLELFLSSL